MQTTWCATLGLCWLPHPLIDCARRCAQVKSIFPDLDSIFYMSERFYNMLSSCNHGYHPLISKQKSDHSGFLQLLIAKLKEMRRKQWHARASDASASPIPEGAVRLEVTLSLSDDELRAQVHGSSPLPQSSALSLSHPPAPPWLQWQGLPRFAEAFAGDLAAALKIPAHAVVVVETAVTSQPNVETVVTSRPNVPQRGSLAAAAAVVGITMGTSPPPRANAGGANVVVAVFDLLPRSSQQDSASDGSRPSTRSTRLGLLAAKMAVNRRVDALAAALSLASDFSGPPPRKELVGPLAISTRAQQGAATRAIERAAGLRQVSADGQRTRVWPIDSETLLSSIPLSSESWVTLVQRFTPSKPVSALAAHEPWPPRSAAPYPSPTPRAGPRRGSRGHRSQGDDLRANGGLHCGPTRKGAALRGNRLHRRSVQPVRPVLQGVRGVHQQPGQCSRARQRVQED